MFLVISHTPALRVMVKKTCIVGDSHIRRFNNILFNNSINEGKAHVSSFSGTTINRLYYFITAIFEEDLRDIVIIDVGSNDITHNTINSIDAKGISKRISDNTHITSPKIVQKDLHPPRTSTSKILLLP